MKALSPVSSPVTASMAALAPADGARSAAMRTSLHGDLEVFRAYDVCQLLGLARATGSLILRATGVRGAIYLEEGRVIGARSRPHPRRLGSLLLATGAIGEAALARAIGAQIGGDRRPLGEILVAAGALAPAPLATALAAQAREALTALLLLPAGRFAFARGLLPPAEDRRLEGVDPRALVLDAVARLDERSAGRPPQEGGPPS